MKKLLLIAALALPAMPSIADTQVDGHFRKDGTYVAPHQRTDGDSRRDNNWSARGNTNPHTGQRGSQRHEGTNPPAYNKGRR